MTPTAADLIRFFVELRHILREPRFHTLTAEQVARIGDGDPELGRRRLDDFVERTRRP